MVISAHTRIFKVIQIKQEGGLSTIQVDFKKVFQSWHMELWINQVSEYEATHHALAILKTPAKQERSMLCTEDYERY